jgi:hypothetical protein
LGSLNAILTKIGQPKPDPLATDCCNPMTSASDKFVVCKGTSGMGNRILAACTALLYGDIVGRQVVIDWRDQSYAEPGENAFPKFFDCPSAVAVAALPETDAIAPKLWAGNLDMPLGKLQPQLDPSDRQQMSVDISRADYTEDILVFCSYTHKIDRLRNLFVGQYAAFKALGNPAILRKVLADKMSPVPEIQQAINTFKDQCFGPETIGVHVRYTDMKIPLEKLLAQVQAVAQRSPHAVIFLATDAEEVVDQFKAQFPRLVTTNKWFPPDGQRLHQNWDHCPNRYQNGVEALTDLWLLSECDRLVFSSKSSFGYVASLLSKAGDRNIFDVELNQSWPYRVGRQAKHMLKPLLSRP